jgi:hypothetical protein
MNVGCNVGFRVGLIGAPDIALARVINNLGDACRKCRALRERGRLVSRRNREFVHPQLFGNWDEISQPIHLIGLD